MAVTANDGKPLAFNLGVNSVLEVLNSGREEASRWIRNNLIVAIVIAIAIAGGFIFVGLVASGKALLNRGIFGFRIA